MIVIGASAGGVEAVTKLVAGLPHNLPAALLVTLHFSPHRSNVLPDILNRAGTLPAKHGIDGEIIHPGCIYVAQSDHHMLVTETSNGSLGQIHLSRGPRLNGHRPAIDALLSTAARVFGSRVIGVILTGTLDDGSLGLRRVKACGGIAVVQEPGDAQFPSMPLNALESTQVDHIVPLSQLADLLASLTQQPNGLGEGQTMSLEEDPRDTDGTELIEHETELLQQDKRERERGEHPGQTTMFTCPECGGVLWELQDGHIVRFRCHVGHSYSVQSLVEGQSETVGTALWTAVRVLEERAALARRLANRASEQKRPLSAARFITLSEGATQSARIIREVITSGQLNADTTTPEEVTGAGAGFNVSTSQHPKQV